VKGLLLGFLAVPVVASLCLLGGKVSYDFGAEGVMLCLIFLAGTRQ
jgi:Flp pilus assembly pilin Flp